jgi:hypothetical protein
MARVAAAFMGLAARMSSIMHGRRRRAVNVLTREPRNTLLTAIKPNPAVTTRFGERPNQAVVAGEGKNGLTEKPMGFAHRCIDHDIWIAVSPPLFPMPSAPPARLDTNRLAAIGDQTYTRNSHLDLRTGWAWLERVVGLQAFGAFAFCTMKGAENKHGLKPRPRRTAI